MNDFFKTKILFFYHFLLKNYFRKCPAVNEVIVLGSKYFQNKFHRTIITFIAFSAILLNIHTQNLFINEFSLVY